MTAIDAATFGLAPPPAFVAPLGETWVVATREQLAAIETEWLALEAAAPDATLFQGFGWARAVFDFEAARGNPHFAPVVATLRRRGRLVAVLPLERIDGRFRTALMPLGGAFPQYADFLADPAIDAKAALLALLKAASATCPADMVTFLKVRASSQLAKAMPPGAVATGNEAGAPFVDLSGFADFPAYFASIKPKTRKNMRNARNRLEREAPLTHHVATTPDETLGIIRRTIAGRAGRLKDQGLTSRAFTDPAFAQFCENLAGRPDVTLLAMSLRHGGEPIAEQWGFVHQKRYYAFVASRDFEQSDESPGKLHLKEVIETAAAQGLDTADLLVPVMPYKLTWATGVETVADYAVPLTLKGYAGIALWDQRLRPWAKALFLALPKGLRSLAMRAAGRG